MNVNADHELTDLSSPICQFFFLSNQIIGGLTYFSVLSNFKSQPHSWDKTKKKQKDSGIRSHSTLCLKYNLIQMLFEMFFVFL